MFKLQFQIIFSSHAILELAILEWTILELANAILDFAIFGILDIH